MLISNGGPDLDIVAMGRYPVTDINGVTTVSLGTSNATTAVATRLAQNLSDGSSLASVMEKVNGSLQNAYRTVTDFVKKYW
jgi:type II secretory pathway component PulF